MSKHTSLLIVILALFVAPLLASSPAGDANWKIRREGVERSSIMQTLHVLTDVHGPRLTGSPSIKAAQDWAVEQLQAWGLAARLEPWDFGHEGWTNERLAAHLVSPVKDALVVEALAWTPGTNGPVTAGAFHLQTPRRPTRPELESFLQGVGDAVKGRIVLVGAPEQVPVSFNPAPKRRDEQELRAQYDPVDPAPSPFARQPAAPRPADGTPAPLTARQQNEMVDAFLVARGALVRVNDAGRAHGQVRAFGNRTFDSSKAVPTIVMRNEDFGRVARLLAGERPVALEVDIANRAWPEGRTQYNVIAEIPGTDKAAEVVMLGGHIDSWHAATGATDNAIGVAVTMEAVRILKALGLTPRRTIRLALWSGEEQGLLGSQAYVKQHFGTAEEPKAAHATFGGYVNIDSGTGRARGMSVFGPPEGAAVLRALLAPFADLGVMGTVASKSRRIGGTDHTAFNAAGLPGIGVSQDPIEYGSTTWHTNLDTYERIVGEDAQKSAIVIAATVYELATRDALLARFGKDEMPKPAPATPDGEETPAPARTTTTTTTR